VPEESKQVKFETEVVPFELDQVLEGLAFKHLDFVTASANIKNVDVVFYEFFLLCL